VTKHHPCRKVDSKTAARPKRGPLHRKANSPEYMQVNNILYRYAALSR
jgi:hypothetical protein